MGHPVNENKFRENNVHSYLLDEFSISFGSDENKWTRNDNAGGWALDKLDSKSLQPLAH